MENIIEKSFDHWAIIEVFGHEKYAGRVSAEKVGDQSMIRLDVPEVNGLPGFVKFLNPASVFSITPVSEEYAQEMAAEMNKQPIAGYDHAKVIKKLAQDTINKMTMDQVKKLAFSMSQEEAQPSLLEE